MTADDKKLILEKCPKIKLLFTGDDIPLLDPRVICESLWRSPVDTFPKLAKYINSINIIDVQTRQNLLHKACESNDGFAISLKNK